MWMSSVIIDLRSNQIYSFMKGSPEWIKSMVDQNSLPDDFDDVLQEYTSEGFWVIALAYKKIQITIDVALSIER